MARKPYSRYLSGMNSKDPIDVIIEYTKFRIRQIRHHLWIMEEVCRREDNNLTYVLLDRLSTKIRDIEYTSQATCEQLEEFYQSALILKKNK